MEQTLKIVTVLSACYFASYFVLSKLTPHQEKLRQYFIASLIILLATALSRSVAFGYLAAFSTSLYFGSKSSAEEKIALFFALAFTLPFTIGIELNPGINLGSLNYPKVLTLTLLLPLLFNQAKEPGIAKLNVIDKAIILYVAWMFLLNLRLDSATVIMRVNTWLPFEALVPYLAIRFFTKDYALVFAAISFALFAQSLVGVAEALFGWYIYTDLQLLSGFADAIFPMYKYRFGFLRAQGSFMNPLIYALFSNLAFLAAIIYMRSTGQKRIQSNSRTFAWIALLFTGLGMLAPMSRAAILGSLILLLISLMIFWAIRRYKDPKKLLICLFSVSVVSIFWLGGDLIKQNFQYRTMLFEVSMEVIMNSPLTGYLAPRELEAMQVLRQGEGIIDLVNAYLGIALHYGLPALALFAFAILASLSRTYSSLRICRPEYITFGVFVFSGTFLFAFNLMTTSSMDWSDSWIWITTALSSNFIARVQTDKMNRATPGLL